MDRTRLVGWRLACVLALVIACVAAGGAAASPQDVVVDWQTHGQIDGNYSISDLYNAKRLMLRLDASRAGEFAALVDEKIEADFLGIVPKLDPSTDPIPSVPPADLPLWVTAMAVGALLLAAGGVGSAVYRRRHRTG